MENLVHSLDEGLILMRVVRRTVGVDGNPVLYRVLSFQYFILESMTVQSVDEASNVLLCGLNAKKIVPAMVPLRRNGRRKNIPLPHALLLLVHLVRLAERLGLHVEDTILLVRSLAGLVHSVFSRVRYREEPLPSHGV